jgi:hypothetical protein
MLGLFNSSFHFVSSFMMTFVVVVYEAANGVPEPQQ